MRLNTILLALVLIGLGLAVGPAVSQNIAPIVQPVFNNNGSPQPVTSSSGLPVNCVTGCAASGQTFPTSSPGNAQLVVPANPSAQPYTAALPLPVSTINASLPAPQATWPDSTPTAGALPTASAGAAAPGSAPIIADYPSCQSNGGNAAVTAGNSVALQCDPQGKLYVSFDDPTSTIVKSSSINSAVTTLLVTGVATKVTYIYLATWESTGTNSTNTINWEWGTGATCGTSTVTLLPAAIAPGLSTGEWMTGWAGSQGPVVSVSGMPAAATRALILPAGNNFCGVTAGTTTLGNFVTYYSIH